MNTAEDRISSAVFLKEITHYFIINLRRCFSKEDGKGTYDEDTIREAAKYYLYQDAGIRLKFQ